MVAATTLDIVFGLIFGALLLWGLLNRFVAWQAWREEKRRQAN
jgi:hypothetical protein